MTALLCPETPCTVTEDFIGELAAHLIASHAYARPDAVRAAKKVQSQADPFGLDRAGIQTHVEPPVTPAVTPPASEETPMAAHAKKTEPAACKLCKRFAPEKCKHHGGRDRSQRTGGGKPATTKRARPPEPAVRNGSVALVDNAAKDAGEKFLGHLLRVRDSLDTKITGVKELLALL